eukprot:3233827-Rhodomonas_salina.1
MSVVRGRRRDRQGEQQVLEALRPRDPPQLGPGLPSYRPRFPCASHAAPPSLSQHLAIPSLNVSQSLFRFLPTPCRLLSRYTPTAISLCLESRRNHIPGTHCHGTGKCGVLPLSLQAYSLTSLRRPHFLPLASRLNPERLKCPIASADHARA